MSAEIEHHRRTRRLLWTMLIAAAVASMAGNIAAAGEHRNPATAAGSIAAAAIPPLALLSLTHLAGMWSRIRARGIVYWCFLVMVAAIATAAFRLSFDALRSLAMGYGYGPADAALFPLILDGLVAVCTLGLVMLARIEADDAHRDARPEPLGADHDTASASGVVHPGPDHPISDADRDTVRSPAEPVGALESLPTALVLTAAPLRTAVDAALNSADARAASGDAWWGNTVTHRETELVSHRVAERSGDAHRGLALRLVDAGRTTLEPDTVQAVLDLAAAGESGRAVAAQLGLSASAVQRVIKAARTATPL